MTLLDTTFSCSLKRSGSLGTRLRTYIAIYISDEKLPVHNTCSHVVALLVSLHVLNLKGTYVHTYVYSVERERERRRRKRRQFTNEIIIGIHTV